jgi:hypothetical protein
MREYEVTSENELSNIKCTKMIDIMADPQVKHSKLVKHEIDDYKSDVTKKQVLADIEKVALFKPLSSAESQHQASSKT